MSQSERKAREEAWEQKRDPDGKGSDLYPRSV